MTGFERYPTAVLWATRERLVAGLDKVAQHLDAGTYDTPRPSGAAPPSQSGQLTRIFLELIDSELARREREMREIVLCDVDGTVALMGKGQPGRRGPFEWHRVGEDDPNVPVIRLVRTLRAAGFRIIFLSGRDEVCRSETVEWLTGAGAAEPGDLLLMRAEKDNRPDDEVKLEIYKREIEGQYRVVWVLDDRDKVVRMWRDLGLTVLQVAPGDF